MNRLGGPQYEGKPRQSHLLLAFVTLSSVLNKSWSNYDLFDRITF